MEYEKPVDWRIQAIARLAKDLPPAYPGGPSHKAGAIIYPSTVTRESKGNTIGFIRPSPTALALSIAIKASKKAVKLRQTIAFEDVVTPHGSGKSVAKENTPHLYDYFEYCMIAVTFSFQALETFCNDMIAKNLKGTYSLQRRNSVKKVSADELQRIPPTEEKLSTILPDILKIESPKSKKVWQNFKELKRTRDTTIHLKTYDAYSQGKIDKESLFYEFFRTEADEFPRFALEMIKFFTNSKEAGPWLELARNQISDQ